MAHIRIGEELFNVAVNGPREAPVLLMSNSLGTDLRMWEPQMPELTKIFKVIRYDSRGHGESAAEPGAYTIERLGRDAVAILDKLGIDKAHFVGLSKGGMVGQWLLTHAPSRIVRAVLANTSAKLGAADIWDARAQTARKEGMKALAKPTLERWLTPGFRRANPRTVGQIEEMILNTPAEGYAACCLAIRDMDQRQSIRAIRKPVLVIVGRHDPATVPADGQQIAESIPGARLITLEAAHLSNVEAPEAFTQAVIGFLTGKAVGEAGKAAAPLKAAPAAAPEPAAPKAEPTPAKPEPRKAAAKAQPAPRKQAEGKKPAAKKPAPKAAAKKAVAKKTAPKKTTVKQKAAKKAPARKAAAGKAAVKKPAAKKSPARKAAAKKAPVKKTALKKAPAKKAAVKKAAAKKAVKKPAKKARR